jgi:hypothetical protein
VSTPERVSRWLARVEGAFAVGQEFTLHFDDGTATFDVVSCDPPTAATVRWKGTAGDSLVTVAVSATGAATSRLVLEHSGLPVAQAAGYCTGWHWHLGTLRAQLEDTDRSGPTWDQLAAHYQQVITSG